jgi:exodeoxyribonuclease VII small subunit
MSPRTKKAPEDDVSVLGYEEARDALVDVVRRLESGGEPLEESLALWQRGEALARHCERWLAGAQEQVERALRAQDEGDATAEDDETTDAAS